MTTFRCDFFQELETPQRPPGTCHFGCCETGKSAISSLCFRFFLSSCRAQLGVVATGEKEERLHGARRPRVCYDPPLPYQAANRATAGIRQKNLRSLAQFQFTNSSASFCHRCHSWIFLPNTVGRSYGEKCNVRKFKHRCGSLRTIGRRNVRHSVFQISVVLENSTFFVTRAPSMCTCSSCFSPEIVVRAHLR